MMEEEDVMMMLVTVMLLQVMEVEEEEEDESEEVMRVFRPLQLLTACFGALRYSSTVKCVIYGNKMTMLQLSN